MQRTQTGLVRVVVDLAARDLRTPLVEQADQGAHQAGLALAALAEQHQVVAGQQRGLQLGQDGVVEADDAGKGGLAGRSRATRLARISSLTVRGAYPDSSSWPRVAGAGC